MKIDYSDFHKPYFAESLSVVEQLWQQNIDFINKIFKTKDNKLYSVFKDGIIALFYYENGINNDNYPAKPIFEKLSEVYRVSEKIDFHRREDFSVKYADYYFSVIKKLENTGYKKLLKNLTNQSKIMLLYAQRLDIFSKRCKKSFDNFYITHGDAGGNIIANEKRIVIVDWDYPLFAPPERDAWFGLGYDNVLDEINNTLAENGINYQLNYDRLAFYAYSSFFYYFHECFRCLFELENKEKQDMLAEEIPDMFNCWITVQLDAADKIK